MSLNLHDVNITWNFIDTEVWSTLELDIAMICGSYQSCYLPYYINYWSLRTACLPSIRPVLALVFQKAMGSNSRSGLFGKAKGNSSKLSDGVWAGGFSKHHDQGDDSKRTHGKNSNKDIFGDEEHDDRTHFTKTTIVAGSHRTLSSDDVELAQMHAGKAVLVSTDVKMEWENRVWCWLVSHVRCFAYLQYLEGRAVEVADFMIIIPVTPCRVPMVHRIKMPN